MEVFKNTNMNYNLIKAFKIYNRINKARMITQVDKKKWDEV